MAITASKNILACIKTTDKKAFKLSNDWVESNVFSIYLHFQRWYFVQTLQYRIVTASQAQDCTTDIDIAMNVNICFLVGVVVDYTKAVLEMVDSE